MAISTMQTTPDFLYHQQQFVELMQKEFASSDGVADNSSSREQLIQDGETPLRQRYFSVPSQEIVHQQKISKGQKYCGITCGSATSLTMVFTLCFGNIQGALPALLFTMGLGTSYLSSGVCYVRGHEQEQNNAYHHGLENLLPRRMSLIKEQSERLEQIGEVYQAIYNEPLNMEVTGNTVADNLRNRIVVLIDQLKSYDEAFENDAIREKSTINPKTYAEGLIKLLTYGIYLSHMKRHEECSLGYRTFVEKNINAISSSLKPYLSYKYQFVYSFIASVLNEGPPKL